MSTLAPYRAVDEEEARSSAMLSFLHYCEDQTKRSFPDYLALHTWACCEYQRFWQLFARWSQLPFSGNNEPAVSENDCERARFFPEMRLNYARCLLRDLGNRSDERAAVVGVLENGERIALTRCAIREAVERCAAGLTSLGVQRGDRVVAIARNTPAAVIACLATAAIGATWSSVGPDIGHVAALSRFKQLSPVALFTNTQYAVHGVTRSLRERIELLRQELPTLRSIVALDAGTIFPQPCIDVHVTSLDQLLLHDRLRMEDWIDFPFNHPLFILFSSGTTGAPKCLVHGAGGTLIEHYKEHVLHSSLNIGEKLCFQTSAGWMMWNWQISALACGTEVILFDGSSTFATQDALLKLIDREQVTVFGTSAPYLRALQQLGISPKNVGTFDQLHTIQSTGSILYESQYDWVATQFKKVKVQSISGGTDIIGCFVLGNPLLPIYRGDSQSISLGLDVRVARPGEICRWGEGELVCINAFPSRPIGILEDDNGERFHQTYFAENPGIWSHGDRVRLSEHGSARILGRSDGTLNVRGVRVGPAEIYNIVLAIPGVLHALAVEQQTPRETSGSRLVLLVVLQDGAILDRSLTLRIKKDLRHNGSPNHVPAVIAQLDSLPMTHSGKLSEKAVRDLLNGKPLSNREAIKNVDSLDAISAHPQLQPQT